MNSLEIITDLRHQLAQRIAERGSVPPIAPIAASPWVAMSLLQKSVRRGREDLALRAGATLFLNDPNKLWRRVGGIAFEDIGLADIDTLGVVVAALGGKRVRAQSPPSGPSPVSSSARWPERTKAGRRTTCSWRARLTWLSACAPGIGTTTDTRLVGDRHRPSANHRAGFSFVVRHRNGPPSVEASASTPGRTASRL